MNKSSAVPAVLLCLWAAGSGLAQIPAITPIVLPQDFKVPAPVISPLPTIDPSIPVTSIGYGPGPVFSTPVQQPLTQTRRKGGKKKVAKAGPTLVPTRVVAGEPTRTEAKSQKMPLK